MKSITPLQLTECHDDRCPVLESVEPRIGILRPWPRIPRIDWKPVPLLQWKFDALFGFSRNKAVSGDDSHACIPAQDRVIVARRANGFGFFEASHRLMQKIISLKPAIWRVLTQFDLRAAFGHDSGIIRVVVS